MSNEETGPKAEQSTPLGDRQIEAVADALRLSGQKVRRRQVAEAQEFLPVRILLAASESGSPTERAEAIRAEYEERFPTLAPIGASDVALVAELIEAYQSETPRDLYALWKPLWKALVLDE